MHKRITVTIDEEILAHAERMVTAGQARSLSALFAGAVEKEVKREKLADVMADLLSELGPPTSEEEAWITDALALWS